MAKSTSNAKPYIPAEKVIPEFSPIPLILGVLLGIVFGASSLYLALKVGMTVSASIPIAVLSITIFKTFSKVLGVRRATILESNIVQTTGSAGESIAFGIAVTMPAALILGYDLDLTRITLVAVLGALLGVLMMIPLRYALIVKSHGELTYPEGTACAEVLIAGEKSGTSAKTVFAGFFVGLIYKFFNVAARLWNEVPSKAFSWFKGASISAEVAPELLGVGYIIGPRIACITVAGGLLSSWVLIPMIKLFGDGLIAPIFPATKLIAEMSLIEIWRNYVLYIGAGAVATGGVVSLIQSLPTIIHGAKTGLGSIKNGGQKASALLRTNLDLPLPFVLGGCVALVLSIWLIPLFHMSLIGALLIVVFGFLFVTVSSRLTGEIGSSSNPISGMTVATLIATSLVFLGLGWVEPSYRLVALSVAAIVCVASAVGGTTSQDLKTGYLLGATPKFQQIGLLIGALTSALVIGYTLNVLNSASTIYSRKAVPENVIVDRALLSEHRETVNEPGSDDRSEYRVLRVIEQASTGPLAGVKPGKYLVNDAGMLSYLVDPGINGTLDHRDDGSHVAKYEAPKARLMSLIIDGILTQKLPWGLVLLGVAIALLLELCAIPSLPFAVGVYLPLSSSMPIFIGGAMRWLVDRWNKRKNKGAENEEHSPGILYSSGLIAGGSIAGISLAILSIKEGWLSAVDLSTVFPSLAGSDLFAVSMFALIAAFLVRAGLQKKPSL